MRLPYKQIPVLKEVKSSTGNYNRFILSNAQWTAAKIEGKNYVVYRVFKSKSNKVKVRKITNPYKKILDDELVITSNLVLTFEEMED